MNGGKNMLLFVDTDSIVDVTVNGILVQVEPLYFSTEF